ncbi:hypothetical protein [Rhizobium brockwellii]|uniref:hypothetical protein n=1 Tax=Rhizobium brockwellii TaxID=3019932 RepID=UPI00293DC04C|nr:hypothetical protein [Rhizobium brockwellii]MDV4159318.1 hypothetical protein [Rhizobium brockwellii]
MAYGLSPLEQRRIRSMLTLQPLQGSLIYPILSARYSHPRAGLYASTIEARDKMGTPLLVKPLWLYINRHTPLWVMELHRVRSDGAVPEVTLEDMDRLESFSQLLVQMDADE